MTVRFLFGLFLALALAGATGCGPSSPDGPTRKMEGNRIPPAASPKSSTPR